LRRFVRENGLAAQSAASHKMNGRQSLPPKRKSEKFLKVKLWSIYMIPLELILSEIPEKTNACPARRGG